MGILLRLTLFGGFRVSDVAEQEVSIAGNKPALLLAYLALRAGTACGRETLMGLLWSQRSESQARGSLRHALWALRRAFETVGPYPLVMEGNRISVDPSMVGVDVLNFERCLADGSPEALQSALALYTGELLEGIRVTDPAFEEFLRCERLRLHGMAVDAFSRLLDHQLQAGMHRSALTTAQRLLAIDPLQEVAHRTLMRYYADRGQIGLAYKQYQTCREILQSELQVDPDSRTQQLFDRIRSARPDTVTHTTSVSAEKPEKKGQETAHSLKFAATSQDSSRDVASADVAIDTVTEAQTCIRCRYRNPAGQKFCGNCGKPLAVNCRTCGATSPSGKNYCGDCGARISQGPVSRFSSPDHYIPKHLADRILDTLDALEGERKQATVLVADLKGSMGLVAGREPEDASKILDPLLEHMIDAVHRYEGTVNKVLGDGIMALFGVPLTHEDHAVRACYAALAMRDAVRRVAEQSSEKNAFDSEMCVGLNSGDVVVRAIGNDLSVDYDAIGPTTLLAGRMAQLAVPGTIRLTQHTLRLAEGFIRTKPSDTVPIEGLQHSTRSYELTDAVPTRSRFQATIRRGMTPFVGRDTELRDLNRALARAEKSHGQVFATVGDPGVGKSRLLYEFTHSRRATDRLILESGSTSYDKAMPFLPVIDLLKIYYQVNDRDDVDQLREKVTGKLLSLDQGLRFALPALLGLLDVPVNDPSWNALEPSERRRRTIEAIKIVLLRETQVQPLILVFDDLQWADSETQAFLDSLVESLPSAAILLLVSYRPEYNHGWVGKAYYTQQHIDPLPLESANELLDSILGRDRQLASLKKLLIDRTEGNPFFIEESVHTLVETGTLEGSPGAYRRTQQVGLIEIPATVRGVVVARIDHLAPEDKQLLQTASVIGKDVAFDLLRAIADLPEDALKQCLGRLQTAEFLYETRLFPDPEYTFKHAVTHEVTYESLLVERRQGLHRQIVEAIERLYRERLAEHLDRLAHHAIRGELWERAVDFLRQSSMKSAHMSAYRQAAASLEHAFDALGHVAETRETVEQMIDLRFELRSSLQALGRHESVVECLREAEKLATALGDQNRLGWASAYLSQYLWRMGQPEQAEESGQRALTIASQLHDFSLDAVTNFFLGQGHYNTGDYHRAVYHCRLTKAALKDKWAFERLGLTGLPSVLSRIWLAWSLAEQGQFQEAMVHADEALSIAETADQHYSLAAACLGVGQVRLVQGDVSQAIPLLERAGDLCSTWNLQVIFSTTVRLLSLAYALAGRTTEAMSVLEKDEGQESPIKIFDTPTARTALSTIHLFVENLDEAAKIASWVAELAVERGFRGSQAKTLQLLGDISARRDLDNAVRAESHYRRALELADKLGMGPVAAHCHFGIGSLYQRFGKEQAATEHFSIAETMCRNMDMVCLHGAVALQ